MKNIPVPGIGALTFEVEFDPNIIAPIGCDPDPDFIFDGVTCNQLFQPGVSRLSYISPLGASGSHVLANLGFVGVGPLHTGTPVTFTLVELADPAGVPMSVTSESGFVVLDADNGDVNCDAQVDSVDALYILQLDSGIMAPSPICPPDPGEVYIDACDVNGDSMCTSVDALFIMQCEIGIPNTLCPVTTAMKLSPMSSLASADIMVGQGVVPNNGQITVPITADVTDADVGAVTFELKYDPNVVRPTACVADPERKFSLAICNPNYQSDAIRFTLASTQGVTGGINLANITFEAVGEPGDSSPLTATAITFTDAQGQSIPNQIRSGQIDVRSLIFLPITR